MVVATKFVCMVARNSLNPAAQDRYTKKPGTDAAAAEYKKPGPMSTVPRVPALVLYAFGKTAVLIVYKTRLASKRKENRDSTKNNLLVHFQCLI